MPIAEASQWKHHGAKGETRRVLAPGLESRIQPCFHPTCAVKTHISAFTPCPQPSSPPVNLWRLLLVFAHLIANPLFIIPKFIKDSSTSSPKTACFLLKGWIKCGWGSRSSPAGKGLRILPLKGEMIHLQIRVRYFFLIKQLGRVYMRKSFIKKLLKSFPFSLPPVALWGSI